MHFSLNVWLGVIGDHLIGADVFQSNVQYLEFLDNYQLGLLDFIPTAQRAKIILQHQGLNI